jgi:hypothetical protein
MHALCPSLWISIIKKKVLSKTKNIMCPSQNEHNRQEHNKDAANNILIREIESWSNFEYALREETDCSLTRCYLNARTMKTWSELLTLKMSFFSRVTVYGIDIAAAKDHKRIDCQSIRTKKGNSGKLMEWLVRIN